MIFECEGLPGLVLVPPSSPEYAGLLEDIERRIENPMPDLEPRSEFMRHAMTGRIAPECRDTSAILLNQSGKAIAALALIWYYEEFNGRTYTSSRSDTFGSPLLIPGGARPELRPIHLYWNLIHHGSKRYLSERGMAGNNTDVRPPAPNEIWRGGGGIGNGSGFGSGNVRDVRSVKLVIDGVFFDDGGFAGPNQISLWEKVTAEAASRMKVAITARDGRESRASSAEVLAEIERITGPAQPMQIVMRRAVMGKSTEQQIREFQSLMHANEIERMRASIGDDATVAQLASRTESRPPAFYRI